MTAPTIVAMFGLSGVGKGWLARQVCAGVPEVLHLEASALMRRELRTSGEALRTAAPDKMAENQLRLVSAFADARAESPLRPVLFDGHSVIDNDLGLVEIPVAVIAGLGLDRIVFVSDQPATIAERRQTDQRPRPMRSIATLSLQQERARSVAAGYAGTLDIPFLEIQASDWESVSRLFRAVSRAKLGQGRPAPGS